MIKLSALAALGLSGVPVLGACAPATASIPRWRGADISFTLQEEAIGTVLTDPTVNGGSTTPIEKILAARGATAARLRVWVDPPVGYSGEASLLALARRVHAAGMEVVVDLHYSDFWADATTQTIPAAWQGQSLMQLAETVRQYTRRIVSELNAQGTPPSIVQIGNEVTNGMLWPEGQVHFPDGREDWAGFTELLKAGVEGVRDAPGPADSARTMIHIQRIDSRDSTRYTLDHIFDLDVEVDLIGVSYYPFWDGPLDTLRDVLDDLSDRYGKDLLVAETAYPWTIDTFGESAVHVASAGALPEAERFPPTPAGQAAYYAALRDVVAEVRDGRGAGYFAWEPGWLPGVGATPGSGNPFVNLTMFDRAGDALPALAVFGESTG